MNQLVNPDERDPSVPAVAAVSLVAGLACTLAPADTARRTGIDATPAVVRVVGLVDLALALGLFVGRPSWPWLLARAASNPAIAACHWRQPDHGAPVWSLPSLSSPLPPTSGPSPGSAPPPTADGRQPQVPTGPPRSVCAPS
jgi:hypothetical protein